MRVSLSETLTELSSCHFSSLLNRISNPSSTHSMDSAGVETSADDPGTPPCFNENGDMVTKFLLKKSTSIH